MIRFAGERGGTAIADPAGAITGPTAGDNGAAEGPGKQNQGAGQPGGAVRTVLMCRVEMFTERTLSIVKYYVKEVCGAW